jgi:hypothetical protein
MAFIDVDSENPVKHSNFYNVTRAVGKGGYNEKEDVMVVQFFLQRVYLHADMKARKPKGEMKVDGKCGPITCNWILKFQLDMRDIGRDCYPDGLVDKAGNENNADNWNTSISRTHYTIRMLNNGVRVFEPALYKTLPYNPEVPPELRVAFLRMHAEGPAVN